MMFMRPPQYGHGWVAWSVAGALSGGCGWCAVCTGATVAISSRIRAMVSVLVPLASRPQCLIRWNRARQDMHQEPPDELVRLERHGLVAAGSLERPREEAAGTQQMRSRDPFALRTVQSFFCRAEKESLTGRALVPLGISQRKVRGGYRKPTGRALPWRRFTICSARFRTTMLMS